MLLLTIDGYDPTQEFGPLTKRLATLGKRPWNVRHCVEFTVFFSFGASKFHGLCFQLMFGTNEGRP